MSLRFNKLKDWQFYIDKIESVTGRLLLGNNSDISGTLSVLEDVSMHQNLLVSQSITCDLSLQVHGDASLNGDVDIGKNLKVSHNITCDLSLQVDGDTSLNQDVYIGKNLKVSQDITCDLSLQVHGDASLNSDVDIGKNLKVSHDITCDLSLQVHGDTSLNGDVRVGNNLNVLGTITSSDITCDLSLQVHGDTSLNGDVRIGNNLNVLGTITSSDITCADLTTTGQINGPSTLIIDPAGVGDNTGLVIIKGGLQIDGNTTIINSSRIDISDHTILLASNATDQTQTYGSGIEISGNKTFKYVDGDIWESNIDLSAAGITTGILRATNIDVLGDISTNNINLGGHIIPTQNKQYDIGSPDMQIRDIYLSSSTLYMGTDIEGEVKPVLKTVGGSLELRGTLIGDISLVEYNVSVKAKTAIHQYYNIGSSSGYFINDLLESPTLLFQVGRTYKFKQDNDTNLNHPMKFYEDAEKTTVYETNVRYNLSPGSLESYTEIFITPQTISTLYYQCENHALMGGKILISNSILSNALVLDSNNDADTIRNLTLDGILKVDTINNNTLQNGVTIDGVKMLNGSIVAGSNSTVTANNFNVGSHTVITASAGASFTSMELKQPNDIARILAYGETGNMDLLGELTVDTINNNTLQNGVTIDGVKMLNGSIVAGSNSTVTANNFNVGSHTVITASAGASFTSMELKQPNDIARILAYGETGNMDLLGELTVDTINNNTLQNGVTIEGVKMSNFNIDTGTSGIIKAATFSGVDRTVITASTGASFTSMELKNMNNGISNTGILAYGDTGHMVMTGRLTANALTVTENIEVKNGLKVDGINENTQAKVLYYNIETKEITYGNANTNTGNTNTGNTNTDNTNTDNTITAAYTHSLKVYRLPKQSVESANIDDHIYTKGRFAFVFRNSDNTKYLHVDEPYTVNVSEVYFTESDDTDALNIHTNYRIYDKTKYGFKVITSEIINNVGDYKNLPFDITVTDSGRVITAMSFYPEDSLPNTATDICMHLINTTGNNYTAPPRPTFNISGEFIEITPSTINNINTVTTDISLAVQKGHSNIDISAIGYVTLNDNNSNPGLGDLSYTELWSDNSSNTAKTIQELCIAAGNNYVVDNRWARSNIPINREIYYTTRARDYLGQSKKIVIKYVRGLDIEPPIITLSGETTMTISQQSSWVDPGIYSIIDNDDGDMTSNNVAISIKKNEVTMDLNNFTNEKITGTDLSNTYTIYYDISDAAGNLATAFRTVTVEDTTGPVFDLSGPGPVILFKDASFIAWADEIKKIEDFNDGILDLENIVVTNADGVIMDINTITNIGADTSRNFTIYYVKEDSFGNDGSVNRIIEVISDVTAPVITLSGGNIHILRNSTYNDPGVLSVIDNNDGTIPIGNVTTRIPTAINTAELGEYTIHYDISDAAGNLASVSRTINVVDPLYEDHNYFGWAPTATSIGGDWAPIEITIVDNNIDIVDDDSIEYVELSGITFYASSSPPNFMNDSSDINANHFIEYPSITNWQTYWENNKKPLFYRKTEETLSHTEMVSKIRSSDTPNNGLVVSSSSPYGPWSVRGEWGATSLTPQSPILEIEVKLISSLEYSVFWNGSQLPQILSDDTPIYEISGGAIDGDMASNLNNTTSLVWSYGGLGLTLNTAELSNYMDLPIIGTNFISKGYPGEPPTNSIILNDATKIFLLKYPDDVNDPLLFIDNSDGWQLLSSENLINNASGVSYMQLWLKRFSAGRYDNIDNTSGIYLFQKEEDIDMNVAWVETGGTNANPLNIVNRDTVLTYSETPASSIVLSDSSGIKYRYNENNLLKYGIDLTSGNIVGTSDAGRDINNVTFNKKTKAWMLDVSNDIPTTGWDKVNSNITYQGSNILTMSEDNDAVTFATPSELTNASQDMTIAASVYSTDTSDSTFINIGGFSINSVNKSGAVLKAGTDISTHRYFGVAPTSDGTTWNYWAFKFFYIRQGGNKIGSAIVGQGNDPSQWIWNQEQTPQHNPPITSSSLNWQYSPPPSSQYGNPSGWDWANYWNNNLNGELNTNGQIGPQPVFSIEITGTLDGTVLEAEVGHYSLDYVPRSGFIVSAESPDGPWLIRATFSGAVHPPHFKQLSQPSPIMIYQEVTDSIDINTSTTDTGVVSSILYNALVNEWRFYVVSKKANVIKFYVDGNLIGENDYADGTFTSDLTALSTIGSNSNSSYHRGHLKDIGVWSGGLTDDEVKNLQNDYGVNMSSGADASLVYVNYYREDLKLIGDINNIKLRTATYLPGNYTFDNKTGFYLFEDYETHIPFSVKWNGNTLTEVHNKTQLNTPSNIAEQFYYNEPGFVSTGITFPIIGSTEFMSTTPAFVTLSRRTKVWLIWSNSSNADYHINVTNWTNLNIDASMIIYDNIPDNSAWYNDKLYWKIFEPGNYSFDNTAATYLFEQLLENPPLQITLDSNMIIYETDITGGIKFDDPGFISVIDYYKNVLGSAEYDVLRDVKNITTATHTIVSNESAELSTDVDISNEGIYLFTYKVTKKSNNNTGRAYRYVEFRDNTEPIIKLNGNMAVQVTVDSGASYIDIGATASIGYTLTSSSDVNLSTAGNYTITYNANNGEGDAIPVTRNVIVVNSSSDVNVITLETTVHAEGDVADYNASRITEVEALMATLAGVAPEDVSITGISSGSVIINFSIKAVDVDDAADILSRLTSGLATTITASNALGGITVIQVPIVALQVSQISALTTRQLAPLIQTYSLAEQINGSIENELFGNSIAMSKDGKTLAATGTSETKVYTTDDRITWTQWGAPIDGGFVSSSLAPSTVVISDDGTKVALGNSALGGKLNVWEKPSSSAVSEAWTQLGSDISGDGWGIPETPAVYTDLSSYQKLLDAGFSFSGVNYAKPTTSGFSEWTDNTETIPGYTTGSWDYAAEPWWDSRSPNAFAFFRGGAEIGKITLTLSATGIYTFIVGSSTYHRDTGVYLAWGSNTRFLLNDQELFVSDEDNNSLQKTIQFTANAGDVITLTEGHDEPLIYGYYFKDPQVDANNSTNSPPLTMSADGLTLAVGSPNHDTVTQVDVNFSNHTYFGVVPTGSSGNDFWAFNTFKIVQSGVDLVKMADGQSDSTTTGNLTWSLPYNNKAGWGWQYHPSQPWRWLGDEPYLPLFYLQTELEVTGAALTATIFNYDATHGAVAGHFLSSADGVEWVVRGSWPPSDVGWPDVQVELLTTMLTTTIVNDVGKVSVYDYVTDNWQPRPGGDLLVGVNADDKTGTSLAMSADGLTLAVGSPNHDSVDALYLDHIYYGITPTANHSSSAHGAWSFTGWEILQNGVNIFGFTGLADPQNIHLQDIISGMVTNVTPSWSGTGTDGIGFNAGYASITGAPNYTPLVYLEATVPPDGSQLTSNLRQYPHIWDVADSGHIVSSPDGTVGSWVVRASWTQTSIVTNYQTFSEISLLNGGITTYADVGQVRVYDYIASSVNGWVPRPGGDLLVGANAGDNVGARRSVAMSDDGLIIATTVTNNSPQVSVYEYTSGQVWNQRGSVPPLPALVNSDTEFTPIVSLSSDGNVLAVGVPWEQGKAILYYWDDSSWNNITTLTGNANDDMDGLSIALSSDGMALAVGSPNHDGVADDIGQVRVYNAVDNYNAILAGRSINYVAPLLSTTQLVPLVQSYSLAKQINGSIENELFGNSIAMSKDGKTLVATGTADTKVYTTDDRITWTQWGAPIDGGFVSTDHVDHKYFGVIPTGSSVQGAWAFYRFKITQSGVDIIYFDPNNNNNVTWDTSVINIHSSSTWGWQYGGANNPVYLDVNTPLWYVETNATIDGTPLIFELIQYDHDHTPLSGNFVSASSPSGPWVVRNSWLLDVPLTSVSPTPSGSGYKISPSSSLPPLTVVISDDGTKVALGNSAYENGGKVNVWEKPSSGAVSEAWTQLGSDISGLNNSTIIDGQSAGALTMSADGLTLAVGSPNHNDVGKVSVYDYVTDNWQPRPGGDLLVSVNADDKTGTSLAMSANGLTLAVGSPNHDAVPPYADHIYFGIVPTGNHPESTHGMWGLTGWEVVQNGVNIFGISGLATYSHLNDDSWPNESIRSHMDDLNAVATYNVIPSGYGYNSATSETHPFGVVGQDGVGWPASYVSSVGASPDYTPLLYVQRTEPLDGTVLTSNIRHYPAPKREGANAELDYIAKSGHIVSSPDGTAGSWVVRASWNNAVTTTVTSLLNGAGVTDVGKVSVYDYVTDNWQPRPGGDLLVGANAGDNLGARHGVAMSDDGLIIAVGSPNHDRVVPLDVTDHTYFGVAPTTPTSNGSWRLDDWQITQNGSVVLPGAGYVPYFVWAAGAFVSNIAPNDGGGSASYISWGAGFDTQWATNNQPLFYVQKRATVTLDGTELESTLEQGSTAGMSSSSGHIVSAANPTGPWVIRASWGSADTTVISQLGNVTTVINNSAQVSVYEYTSDQVWNQRGSVPLVELANSLASILSLSSDGNVLAVGAPGESVAAERSPAYFGLAPTGNTAHSTGDWAVLNFEVLQNGNNIINGATVEFFVTPYQNPGNPFATSGGYFQYSGAEFNNYWYNNNKPVVYLKANNAIDSSQIDAEIVFWVDRWPSSGNIVYATDPAGPWNVIGQWGTQPVDTWALLPDAGRKQVIALSPLPSLLPPPGKAILYHWDQGAWNNITTLTGNATDDLYGLSLALSSDGMTLAVGVTNYEIGATELRIGQVRVYNAIDDNNAILAGGRAYSYVPDSIKPVIVLNKLNGQVDMSIDEGVLFSDPGVESVTDEFDYSHLLSINDVEIVIPPNIADVGSHTITYSVTDKRGRVGYAYRTVTVNSLGFRYWGVGSKNGLWSNNNYRYLWATFYDENDVILNDENFKYVTNVTNGVPTFYSTTSPYFNNYTNYHYTTDPVAFEGIHTRANWSLYQHPAMYVDLGSPKDVRKVIHMSRNNHTMYDPIIVASNDEVNWTIVKELDGVDNYNSPGYGSAALWPRTITI